jgi:putative ABC transport system ATP-binding protein
MPEAPEPVIEVRDLAKCYKQGCPANWALAEIDLRIERGQMVALRGPSGSGKSTLLNILGCLDRPTRGSYRLGGFDVSKLDRTEQAWVRLHYIGFIFQSFHLLPRATVLENVMLPLFYANVSRADREAKARELLGRVGLGHRLDHLPPQLSGGERQRVAIARALAQSPRLLLADEPTGALDSHTGMEILQLIAEISAETRATVVMVTHDAAVASHADRQVHLLDGRITHVAEGDDSAQV